MNFVPILKEQGKFLRKENGNKCYIVHNSIVSNETQEILIWGIFGD